MESLNNRIAVVTGGTRGIGRAIAERLLREGARVAICGRTPESTRRAGDELRSLGTVFAHPADVTNVEEVRQFFEAVDQQFGGLDILVNNAGAGIFRKVAEMTPEDWRLNIDLNLNGPFYCSREALARFATRGGGFIVNISSLAGKNAFSGGAGYNASKAGLNLFTEALMLDHRHDNVRVTYRSCPAASIRNSARIPAGAPGDNQLDDRAGGCRRGRRDGAANARPHHGQPG